MMVVKIKKQTAQKVCQKKRKLKFEDYKNWLEPTQLKNKVSHLERNKIYKNSFKKDRNEFIKRNKLI